MRRVLVTGADGFLGRHLLAALVARGDRATALDLGFADGLPEGVATVRATVTDRAAVDAAVAGHDAVIHAAAIADLAAPREGAHDAVNRAGSEVVLDAAMATGARLVLVSSCMTLVATNTPPGAVVAEGETHAPEALLGPYPASKRRAELAIERAAAAGGDALSVLPTAPVGPGDARPTPPGRMILDLARGATPALVDTRLDLVDVRALAGGVLAALDRGHAGRRYLLAGETLALSDLAARVAGLTGVAAPRTRVPMALALATAQVEEVLRRLTGRLPTAPLTGVRLAARPVGFDCGLARADLGWLRPSLDPALADAIAWAVDTGRLEAAGR